MTDEGDRFAVKATAESHFSWLRTRLSVERTLMSWVRTSVALIGFGFTIVQFFERLPALSGKPAILPEAPRYLGLALIGAGVLALLVSGQQYRRVLGYLWGREFEPIAGMAKDPVQTPLYIITIGMIFIGLFAALRFAVNKPIGEIGRAFAVEASLGFPPWPLLIAFVAASLLLGAAAGWLGVPKTRPS